MFEEQISLIRQEQCSSYDRFILEKHDAFYANDGSLDDGEKDFIQGILKIRDAMNLHLQDGVQTVSDEIRLALSNFGLEVDEFVCEIPTEDSLGEEQLINEVIPDILPNEVNNELLSAINGIFGVSGLEQLFGGPEQEEVFINKYTAVLIEEFPQDDFRFNPTDGEISQARGLLAENGVIKDYAMEDRRSNYVIGIVAREMQERGIVIEIIPSYERNLTQRVLPILDGFDRDGILPEVESFPEADELINQSDLTLMDSPLWTLDSSILRKSQREGQQGLVYGDPSLRVLMHVIIQELANQSVDYTPNIGSILRPRPYNRVLPGASNRSPHLRGIGLDLDLGSTDLENILKDLDTAGYIVLTIESDHYHITLINPEGITEDYQSITPEILQAEDVDEVYLSELFGETVNDQLGVELGGLFIESLWGKIKENPLEYISSEGRIHGGHEFLYPLFKDFGEGLAPELRAQLETKTIDINIFFRISSGPLLRGSRRVHFDELLSPTVYPESDDFSDELRDDGTISDPEFFHSASALLDSELFSDNDLGEVISSGNLEQNLTVFFRFFMHTESNFRNVANQGELSRRSSAEGFYQEINGVIDGIENTSIYNASEGRFTTFQADLNRVVALSDSLSEVQEYVYMDSLAENRDIALASNIHSPRSLSAAEQTLLILSSLLHKSRDNSELEYLLQRALVFGDTQAMRVIYAEFHHTDSSHTATNNRVNDILPLYENDAVIPEVSDEIVDINIGLQLSALVGNSEASETNISGFRAQILQKSLLLLGYEVSDLVFTGDMADNFGPSTKRALISFQIDNGLISSENDSSAGKFGPGTKAALQEQVLARIGEIKLVDNDYNGPLLPPGLRRSDILEVFSR